MPSQKKSIITDCYNLLAVKYDEATKSFAWSPPTEIEKVLDQIIKPEMSFLDIGAGTGQTLSMAISKKAKVCGIDISEEMLKVAAKKFPQAELLLDDIEKGLESIKGRTFETIVASGVLEFIEDIDQCLGNLAKHLPPKGYLCFTFETLVANHPVQHRPHSESREGYKKEGPEIASFYHYRRTTEEVHAILEKLQLKVCEEYGFQAYVKSDEQIPVEYHLILAQAPG